ncbi:probable ATP-dependent RNA helicase DDX28 [Euwallacea similis]|uniref:probable ATP-dependent RNA helicase DDX28 n=1 Tax=Euwallacea similis TaxID=1736056 RepID=UPI00344C1513
MSGRVLFSHTCKTLFSNLEHRSNFASAVPKFKNKLGKGPLLISCKRKEYDYYAGTLYNQLDEVPLASKGWNHSKAKNDYFTLLPLTNDIQDEFYPFEESGVPTSVIEALKGYNIHNATEFQTRAIASIKKGIHTLLAAETGCGKTVGYLLPVIQNLIETKRSDQLNSPRAVILVPNRELVYQVGEIAATLCDSVGLIARTLVGGRTKKMMLSPSFAEVDILVATPGALGKLSTVGIYKLGEVQTLVLDEADSLTDDSFVERIEALVNKMSQAQLVLVSATLPRKLPDILVPYGETMKHVVSSRLHKPLLNINQKFLRITRSVKPANLLQIAKTCKDPMLVFTNRNETCKWLAMFLREHNLPCSNVCGDMHFAIRIEQWNQFVRGETKILSATDVGSRGLNTIQVKHVINYDFPIYAADYIHRIGRVGRLGSSDTCFVTNFLTSAKEIKLVQQIELAVRKDQPLPNVDANITNIVQKKILRKIKGGT